jgi:hypothetical protein
MYWVISHSNDYRFESHLAWGSVLGSTMNIWKGELHKADDQLLLGIL